ncbi:phage tail terminator-like protein [Limnobacter sp.]|uniref:phage tail terminator-like protein n=1 Tax=Limnobacter sp. TaxID=2003368 RepID=UPI0025BE3E65|nr:phage tail terminator-like protein [Limnobacter sp.]
MTLVNARAAIETAINTAVTDADDTVSVVFDNMPFTTPGKTKKYVMVTINFDQATIQAHGAAVDQYAGTVQCGIFTPRNKGSAAAAAIAESVIDGLTSVNASGYTDTYSVKPRVGQITGPTAVTEENNSHFVSVVRCTFTAI